MALKIGFAPLIILFSFFILSSFTGEANADTSVGSLTSSECPTDYMSRHMIEMAEKTKGFLREDIMKHLENSSLKRQDKECLDHIFNSYEAALGMIEKSIDNLSEQKYSEATTSLSAYKQSVDNSLKCNSNTVTTVSDLKGMHQWACSSAADVLNKLKTCKE